MANSTRLKQEREAERRAFVDEQLRRKWRYDSHSSYCCCRTHVPVEFLTFLRGECDDLRGEQRKLLVQDVVDGRQQQLQNKEILNARKHEGIQPPFRYHQQLQSLYLDIPIKIIYDSIF